MNGSEPDPVPDATTLDLLLRVLRLERDPDGQNDRIRLLELLRHASDIRHDDANTGEVQHILALLAASGLGPDPRGQADSSAADRDIADVMDRVASHDRAARARAEEVIGTQPNLGPALATVGSVRDWQQEITRLFTTGPGPAHAQERLEERGIRRPIGSVLGVPDDAWFVETAVIVLGGQWSDGFQSLYEAARRQLRPDGSVVRRRVSGLTGAEPVDMATLGAVLRAPLYDVPRQLSRQSLITRLVGGLAEPKRLVQVLVGEGGYGKTTVALAVAQRADDQMIKTIWVSAPDLDALVDGLHQAATLLGATAVQVSAALVGRSHVRAARLWELLDGSVQRWLVVLDDAGEDAVAHPAWMHRSEAGTVLVTSRCGTVDSWGPHAEVTSVGTLDDDDGARLLIAHLGPGAGVGDRATQDQARALSRLLAGMPLALTSIGTLITSRGGDLNDLVSTVAPAAGDSAVETLVGVCLQAIDTEHRQSARALLRLLACFAPDEPLPTRILSQVAERRWGGLDGLAELRRIGLVEELSLGRHSHPCLRIHPAVAEHSRRDPAYQGASASTVDMQAIQLLDDELGRLDPGLPANWGWIRRIEAHVAELVHSPALRTHEDRATALRLATRSASALMRAGSHLAAASLLDRALAALGSIPADHPALLDARGTRAWMSRLDPKADLARVDELLAAVLVDKQRVLGDRHLATLDTADARATVRAERGLLAPARDAFETVLAERSRVLGPDHPDTLTTRHRLAWVQCLAGQEKVAITELAEVLAQRTAHFGPEHLEVFSTRYRLAWALNRAGQDVVAEKQFRELHDALAVTVGARHPQTLLARGRHAWALTSLYRHKEALLMYRDLLAVQIEVLGADHPRVLHTRHAIACIRMADGRVAEAATEFGLIADRRRDLLGGDHPLTLDSRSFRAWALLQTGRAATAEREFRAVLADRVRILGPRHPTTLISRHLMCRAMVRRGRLADAERELTWLLADELDVLDADNRNVLHVRHSRAYVKGMRGLHDEAEAELRAVLADRSRVVGDDHDETMVTRDVLTWLLGVSGRPVDGLEIGAEVLADRDRVLGSHHPHTLTSLYRQAWLTGLTGQDADSAAQLDRLLPYLLALLGPAHPDTLRCRTAMLRIERRHGNLDDAERQARALVEAYRSALGLNAVDSLRVREELGRVLLALGRKGEARSELQEVLDQRLRVLGDEHPDTRRGRRYLLLADDG